MLLLRFDERHESLPDTLRGRNIAVQQKTSRFSLRDVLAHGQHTFDLRRIAGLTRIHTTEKRHASDAPNTAIVDEEDHLPEKMEISPEQVQEPAPHVDTLRAPDFSNIEKVICRMVEQPVKNELEEGDDDDPFRVYCRQACREEWVLDRETEKDVVEQMIAARSEWCHALLALPSVRTALMADLQKIIAEHQRRLEDCPASHFAHNAAMLQNRKATIEKIIDHLATDMSTASDCVREIMDAELHMPQWFTRIHREVISQSALPMPDAMKQLESLYEDWLSHRERLIKSCTQLVVFIAKKHWKGGGMQNFLDLIEDGNIGLMRGVDKFSLAFNVKLSTYAFWWIEQSIGRGKQDTGRTIRVPVHIQQTAYQLARFRQSVFEKTGQYPTVEEIAQHFSLTAESVNSAMQFLRGEARLDKAVGENADTSFGDLLKDTETPDPTEGASISEMRDAIIAFLNTLPQGHREKMIMYYGLGLQEIERADPSEEIAYTLDKHEYGKAMTLEETANEVDLTRERIRQVNSRSMEIIANSSHPARSILEHHHKNLTSDEYTEREDDIDQFTDLDGIPPGISRLPLGQFGLKTRHMLQLADASIYCIGDLVRRIMANTQWWRSTERQYSFRHNCFAALASVGITRNLLGLPPENVESFIPPSAAQSSARGDFSGTPPSQAHVR